MEDELLEPGFEKSLEAARELADLVSRPGWKRVEELLTKLSNPNRLKLTSQVLTNPATDPQRLALLTAFISGEISVSDKVLRMINSRINYGKSIQKKLNPGTPE